MRRAHERRPRRVLGAHLLELLGHPADGVPAPGRPPDRHRGAAARRRGSRSTSWSSVSAGSEHARQAGRRARLLGRRHAEIARTNIAAFQQLWFDLALGAARLHRLGQVGRVLGHVRPQLHRVALSDRPRRRGLAAVPRLPRAAPPASRRRSAAGRSSASTRGTEDDWKVGVRLEHSSSRRRSSPPTRARRRADADRARHERPRRSTASPGDAGVQHRRPAADTKFNLALWNASGDGENSLAGTVTTDAAGVARFEVPLHAAFALTTVPVS